MEFRSEVEKNLTELEQEMLRQLSTIKENVKFVHTFLGNDKKKTYDYMTSLLISMASSQAEKDLIPTIIGEVLEYDNTKI